jgi:hypothetical protein
MMVTYDIALSHVGVIFGVDTGWRVPEAEWFASSLSEASSLGWRSEVSMLDVA